MSHQHDYVYNYNLHDGIYDNLGDTLHCVVNVVVMEFYIKGD